MRAHTCLVSLLAVVIVGAWATTAAAESIVISQVVIDNGKGYFNGVDQTDYSYNISVTGTGLSGVTVSGPNSTSYILTQDPEDATDWGAYSNPDFATDGALRTAFPVGDYVFNFYRDDATVEHLTVPFDGVAPGGFATGITPANGSTGVSTTPTFSWSPVPADDGIALHMEVRYVNGNNVAESWPPLDISATSWLCPVTLDPGTAYRFFISVAQGSSGTGEVDSTSFPVYSVYTYNNEVRFVTTPEPATLSLLALGGLALLRRRK